MLLLIKIEQLLEVYNISIITNSVLVGECFIRVSDCSIRVFRSISVNNES